jgi:hypothetical protein
VERALAPGVGWRVLRLVILAALLAMAYAAYRWQRNRVLAGQRLLERQQRRREQEEAWERMLAQQRAGE